MSNEFISMSMFILVVASILFGVPVAFSLAGIATFFGLTIFGTNVILQFLVATWGMMKMYSLLAVPLFVFMGSLLGNSGIAERLYRSLYVLLGSFKGGLAVATIIICIFFGACTGVIGAAVITMGIIALPSMISRGYSHEMTTGAICAGGCLGMVIPPSIMLILYGSESGTSIATLFTAAIIPGLLLGTSYAAYIAIRCFIKPSLGPSISPEELKRQSGTKMIVMLCTSVFPILILISLVLGSIMIGVAAPSEAASLGAVGAIFICAGYKKLNYKILKDSLIVTMKITSMVVFIALGAKFFTTVFFRLGGHMFIKEIVMSINLSSSGLFLILMCVLFLLGMFMDWIGLMMVFIPIFNPIIASFGYNEVWYGIIFCLVMCISLLTPPFAYSIFYLKGVSPQNVRLGEMYRGVIPFLIIHVCLVILIYFFPQIVLWLPKVTGLKC